MKTSVDLHNYLQDREVSHEFSFIEAPAKTTEIAAVSLGLKLSEVGKPLLVEADGFPAIVLIPGDCRLDVRKLKQLMNVSKIKFVSSDEVVNLTGYVMGCIPPIAHTESMSVYIDERLISLETIYTCGGQIDTILVVNPLELAVATSAIIADIANNVHV
jgi:Cys-tRNA(Pro) deacylase